MMMLGSLLGISAAMSVGGCNIENCEKGAHCMDGFDDDDDDDDGASEHEQCLALCERMSICGAPQARDFEKCVDACEDRFEVLPQQTAELCACIPRSRCEDVIDGRCTAPGSGGAGGTGGSQANGGSGHGGTYTTGGSDAGGSPTTGGSPGTGGSAETGGSDSGGSSGSSTGGSSTGGTSSGGGGGEDPGTPCTCNCQCPSGESCVDGYCSG
jgi:hypothetical protein